MSEQEVPFDGRFTLRERHVSVPADLRITWRMALLCLIVSRTQGKRCSIEQLHVLSWALRSERAMLRLSHMFAARKIPEEPVVREDPSLQRAIRLALGEGLLSERKTPIEKRTTTNEVPAGAPSIPPYRVVLTKKGEELVAAIDEDSDCFRSEKAFLEEQRPYLTQAHVRALFSWSW